MAYHIAVANRKGGVGKSTIAVMLAQGFAVWGKKRVLVTDLDAQCNASLILVGGQRWLEARKKDVSIADYFYDLYDGNMPETKHYLIGEASDLANGTGKAPTISLLPGSLLLEDVQGELFLKESRSSPDPTIVGRRVRNRIENLLRRFEGDFDVVIHDCAPGLSFAALSALRIADKVLVPFRPDYVSQFAVDRIAMLIEDKVNMDGVTAIPFGERRYVALANCVRRPGLGAQAAKSGADRLMVEEMSVDHPLLDAELPQSDDIAGAFDWQPVRKTIDEKYGADTQAVRKVYDAFAMVTGMARG